MINLILYNGLIITLDRVQARVSALAIDQGRIVAAGSDDDILPLARTGTRKVNLGGKVVIPGLIDAHLHWQWTSRFLFQVNVFELPSKQMAVQRVVERAGRTPAGQWINGIGWSQDYWPDKAFPTAADIDAAVSTYPVYLQAKSGHAAWVNSLALKMANITDSTPDPDGGHIERDEHGHATGLLLENAMLLVSKNIPADSVDQIADQMKYAQELALASGLTGFHDFDGPDCLRALQVLREHGDLAMRAVKNINKEWLAAALDMGVRWGFGDDWIRIGGLKIFADGALGPRTASMIDPYEGEPGNYGIIVTDREEMTDLVGRASAAGLPATIHAIGDRAVHDVLDTYQIVRAQEAARGETPSLRRHRIEHVQIIHPDDVHRLAALNVIASMQPIHATSDYPMSDRYWGSRSRLAYNARVQIDQGVHVAFGSDSPVEPFDPFKGIYAAVTRCRPDGSPGPDGWYPEFRLTMDEALRGYTTGAAYAAGLESHQGQLAAGYFADLVVLDQDPYDVSGKEILNIKVLATMVDGHWRFGEA